MIYPSTVLKVADNTGAKTVKCIRTSSKNSTYATVGQIITISAKTVSNVSKIAKNTVHQALIVRVRYR